MFPQRLSAADAPASNTLRRCWKAVSLIEIDGPNAILLLISQPAGGRAA